MCVLFPETFEYFLGSVGRQFFFILRIFFTLEKHENHSKYPKTRIDVYETLCPQQMLVHIGGKIKNWGGECRDATPTKSLSQNIRVDVNREVKFL